MLKNRAVRSRSTSQTAGSFPSSRASSVESEDDVRAVAPLSDCALTASAVSGLLKRPTGYTPLRLSHAAALLSPKKASAAATAAQSRLLLPRQWTRRLPFIGVCVAVLLALLAAACCFALVLSWLLQQLSEGRTSQVNQQAVLTSLPRHMDVANNPSLLDLRFSYAFQSTEGDSLSTSGAPHRRLQNIVNIGPPEGAAGFDAQNMWDAFKKAPQDYLLLLWFLLNVCLLGCFCSWLCTQRSYQKAVMVSP